MMQPIGGRDSERVQFFAMEAHGMFADGEVRTAKVGVQALARVHGLKGAGGRRQEAGIFEERAGGAEGKFGIPKRGAAMDGSFGNEIQCADFAELSQFVLAKLGSSIDQILNACERSLGACGENCFRGLFTQAFDVVEAQANVFFAHVFFDGAEPIGLGDIDGFEMQSVALRVFD